MDHPLVNRRRFTDEEVRSAGRPRRCCFRMAVAALVALHGLCAVSVPKRPGLLRARAHGAVRKNTTKTMMPKSRTAPTNRRRPSSSRSFVDSSQRRRFRSKGSTVVVSDLPCSVIRGQLRRWLDRIGRIEDIEIRYSKPYTTALVQFRNRTRSLTAVRQKNNTSFFGHNVTVRQYDPSDDAKVSIPPRRGDEFNLKGIVFSATGMDLNISRIREIVSHNGGMFSPNMHRKVHLLISDQNAVEYETRPVRQAKEFRIEIVTEKYLNDSLKAKAMQNPAKYYPTPRKKEAPKISVYIPTKGEKIDPVAAPLEEPPEMLKKRLQDQAYGKPFNPAKRRKFKSLSAVTDSMVQAAAHDDGH